MRPGLKKSVVILVVAGVVVFIIAGIVLSMWWAREYRQVVTGLFNEEQLVIARSVKGAVKHRFSFIEKELILLRDSISQEPFSSDSHAKTIANSLSRVMGCGVEKVEVIIFENKTTYTFQPFGACVASATSGDDQRGLPGAKTLDHDRVWVSPALINASGIRMVLALPFGNENIILFNVNISWFLTPLLKDIRSGKSGYAWVIDQDGNFLFHPDASFIGKSAFLARKKKYPDISYHTINFIQKEKMLSGLEGTSFYESCWHRGITGPIKKLIAYCPIIIPGSPVQKWSVAVVAPVGEIEDHIRKMHRWQFSLQGLVIGIIILAAALILFFEMRLRSRLEKMVLRRTEELKKSEEKYRSLVESAEDFIFTLDSEFNLDSMNSFTANFFGGSPEELTGKSIMDLFSYKPAEKQREMVTLALKTGKSVRDEFEIQTGGQSLWINANFMPLRDEDGKIGKILCIARDITENKRLERNLVTTEKLASIGTLAAGVAHEINNPLGVILGFCELLLRKKEPGTQEYDDLKTIERQGNHCKRIVENLLSFSRVAQQDRELSDVNKCISEIIQVVRHNLEIKNIDLILELDTRVPMVRGDPRQLQQVILNLINNASYSMKDGGSLRIQTSLDRRRKKAVICFQDTGPGIKTKDMEQIFDPFYTTKPEGEGTGLGLFVSYGIITKFGGSIECADSPHILGSDSGAMFIVRLCLGEQEEK